MEYDDYGYEDDSHDNDNVESVVCFDFKDANGNITESLVAAKYKEIVSPARLTGNPDYQYPEEVLKEGTLEILYASKDGVELTSLYSLNETDSVQMFELMEKYIDEAYDNVAPNFYLTEAEGKDCEQLLNSLINKVTVKSDIPNAEFKSFLSHFTSDELSDKSKLSLAMVNLEKNGFDFTPFEDKPNLSIADFLNKKTMPEEFESEPKTSRSSKLKF